MAMILSKKLEEDITMIVESLGCSVYDIECNRAKITVYIDKEGGVSIDDCERVSRDVSVLLDVEDPFSTSYTLEVSSPGINRKLKKTEHFLKALNKRCVVKTHSSIENAKIFKGIIKEIDDKGFSIDTESKVVYIEFDNVKNAKLDEKIGG